MRDRELEQALRDHLAGEDGLTGRAMFGGMAFMLRGHLLACARHDGLMARLGRGNEAWAMALPGATNLLAGTRPMAGWVQVPPGLAADPAIRARLLDAARAFVATLPPR